MSDDDLSNDIQTIQRSLHDDIMGLEANISDYVHMRLDLVDTEIENMYERLDVTDERIGKISDWMNEVRGATKVIVCILGIMTALLGALVVL